MEKPLSKFNAIQIKLGFQISHMIILLIIIIGSWFLAFGLVLRPHPQEFYTELVQPEALRDRRKDLRDAERKVDDPSFLLCNRIIK